MATKRYKPNSPSDALLKDTIRTLNSMEILAETEKRTRFKYLQRDLERAKRNNNPKMENRVRTEMSEMFTQVQKELAIKKINLWSNQGLLPDKIRNKYDNDFYACHRTAISVCYEVLHSLIIDLSNFYIHNGVENNPEKTEETSPIVSAIKNLKTLLDDEVYGCEGNLIEPLKELFTEYADKCYDYMLIQCMPEFQEQAMKIVEEYATTNSNVHQTEGESKV